ncbi:hypothetical protein Glove_174g45 [Diversispora epigaea]|uniref:Uncharacterized protein n=1 Tax=Diversispora epigaea TaxID=1348612 RepID=A0A397IYH9_9GLOM|nr:hypothetical protein Glove_174g45 [Diversispora epigaea]
MSRLHSSIFSNFLFGKIVLFLFLLVLLANASYASVVDESYTSYQDVFDAILNTLFPITFIILFNVSETGRIKRVLLPLFDDILYNTIAWVFPLTASLSYFDIYLISYLSPVACFHIFQSVCAIKNNERIGDLHNSVTGTRIINKVSFSLISSPAILISEIWIVFISYRLAAGYLDPIMIMFLTLFSMLFICSIISFIILSFRFKICSQGWPKGKRHGIYTAYSLIFFYTPNILQTLFITIYRPINFYFVKSCIFILVLYLTRSISYFNDRIPGDFLATSNAITHYYLRTAIDGFYKEKSENQENQENQEDKVDDIV